LFVPPDARAHGVNLFGYVEADTVIVEGYFNDGAPCRDSTIEVFDEHREKLLEGKTDAEGKFSFRAPLRSDLLVRLTASMGHRAEFIIPAKDLPEGLPMADRPDSPERKEDTTPNQAQQSAEGASGDDVATDEMERALERTLARNLEPIRRAIEESRRERRFSDIVGGMGYILGLVGLILYFRSRRERRQ
jgi:nickel transport protein